MTTYTITADDETPSIDVCLSRELSDINPLMYGGFLEHMGRCIYGGIYDPQNQHGETDADGFRTDVLECFRELRMPVLRYPGGNFVATYHWMDGIGPRDKRPRRRELAWLTEESNHIGTDEFMAVCAHVGAEPYLALNMGTGTLDEALAWIEYCNGDGDTYYANLRRANGHRAPYNVKYWALGNETWGPWQVEQLSKEDYAKKAFQWAKALKLAHPDIQLVLCGKTGHDDWDRYVLQECCDLIDMHSIHIYTYSGDPVQNATAPLSAERAIQISAALAELAMINRPTTWLPPNRKARSAPPKICFDEWNVWDEVQAPSYDGGEQAYTLSDALSLAVWLNVFIRQSRHIGMANLAQSVNVLGPLSTRRDGKPGLIKQTLWWPLLLFSRHMHGKTLGVHVRAPAYAGTTSPAWLRNVAAATPWLDVSCAVDPTHNMVNLAVVNIDTARDWRVALTGAGMPASQEAVEVYVVGTQGTNITDTNADGTQRIAVVESTWTAASHYTFPKHSFTLLRWPVTAAASASMDNIPQKAIDS